MPEVTGPLPSATARGKALRREISALGIAASCDAADLWAASRDCSPAALLWTKARAIPHPPDLVVWPEDVDQVAAVIRLAGQREVPVVPAGGGTGTAGGAIAVRGGIVLDTKRLTAPRRSRRVTARPPTWSFPSKPSTVRARSSAPSTAPAPDPTSRSSSSAARARWRS